MCSHLHLRVVYLRVEVTNVIRSLKESSPGWDNMPAFILKQCIDCFVKHFTHTINSSFIEGISPKELKLARVVPIYKAGDSTSITNYRLIYILTCFSTNKKRYFLI